MVFDLGTNLKLASEVTEEMHVVSCVSFSRPGPIWINLLMVFSDFDLDWVGSGLEVREFDSIF